MYNQDNDTLEVYRGFFRKKQSFNTKERIMNSLDEDSSETHYCHLVIIIDRKKHTKEEVLKSFKKYDEKVNPVNNIEIDYPERDIIPLELPKNYVQLVKRGFKAI